MGAQDTCRHCGNPLPQSSSRGGQPAPTATTNAGGPSTAAAPSAGGPSTNSASARPTPAASAAIRQQAEHLASTAHQLAHDLQAEDLAEPTQQTGWAQGPIAGYTAAALPLLSQARATLAAAVAADRASGATWHEIAGALGISADTAARRYRT